MAASRDQGLQYSTLLRPLILQPVIEHARLASSFGRLYCVFGFDNVCPLAGIRWSELAAIPSLDAHYTTAIGHNPS